MKAGIGACAGERQVCVHTFDNIFAAPLATCITETHKKLDRRICELEGEVVSLRRRRAIDLGIQNTCKQNARELALACSCSCSSCMLRLLFVPSFPPTRYLMKGVAVRAQEK